MSKNCLVTKLHGTVENENLEFLNEVIVEFTSQSPTGTDCFVNALNFSSARIIGDGYILDSNGANPVKSKNVPSDGKLYFSAGRYKLGLKDKLVGSNLSLREGGPYKITNVTIDFDKIGTAAYQYIGNLKLSADCKGSLNNINASALKFLYFTPLDGNHTPITGELSHFATNIIEQIHVPLPQVTVNIGAFAVAIKLTELTVNRTQCSGELNAMIQGMIANGRKFGTLQYLSGYNSTYEGNKIDEYTAVTISFLSSTSYRVTINEVTDTWTLSGGVWSKS